MLVIVSMVVVLLAMLTPGLPDAARNGAYSVACALVILSYLLPRRKNSSSNDIRSENRPEDY